MGHERPPLRGKQRGQGLLGVIAIFGIGLSALLYGLITPASLSIEKEKSTNAALALARDALIGRAATDDNRPGSLPCPDFDDGTVNPINVANDGIADLLAGADCPSYIGRLPWKTLGLPDLRDASGERLWYMLSTRFRDAKEAEPINTDTKGNVTVYSGNATTVMTSEAAAVIFAPGEILSTQNRGDAANQKNPSNYLESASGINNASAAGPYIAAPATSAFNDRLLVITAASLMMPAEQRVAREMLTLLQSYRDLSACACYPWAANNFNDDSITDRTRGGVPIDNALPEVWGAGTIPSVPSWFEKNKWGKVFYYAVAPSQTATPTPGTLTVDGVSKNVVLITTGPASASRPSSTLSDYVDDAENNNNDDIFQSPSSSAYARDRVYTK
jgi:hypothetical protein